jgi:hypothetical protein
MLKVALQRCIHFGYVGIDGFLNIILMGKLVFLKNKLQARRSVFTLTRRYGKQGHSRRRLWRFQLEQVCQQSEGLFACMV